MRTAAVLVACAAPALAHPISSFDAGPEGWTYSTRTSASGYTDTVLAGVPAHIAAGGDPGGFIQVADPDANWTFLEAPPAFLGDRRGAGALRWSVRTNVNTFPDGGLVILSGGGVSISAMAGGLGGVNAWNQVGVAFESGVWGVGRSRAAAQSGVRATPAQIAAVLADLGEMLICLEYGATVPEEVVGVDAVRLEPACPADWDLDAGVDVNDLLAFLGDFRAGSADADGDGATSVSDLLAFLGAFRAGCP